MGRSRVVGLFLALGALGITGVPHASANPPGVGTAPGYATVLQMVYTTPPSTSLYGRVWNDGAFGASGIGAFDVKVDVDRNGVAEHVLGFCIEYSNGTHPPSDGTWLDDPASWGQDPLGAPAPAHPPTQKDLIKASYVIWKYGRVGISNDQAAAVAYLVHFYGQDRSSFGSGFSVLVPDVNNNDVLDEAIVVRKDTSTGAATNIDELMKRFDAEAERFGAAFNFSASAVRGGLLGTPVGVKSKVTGKALPTGTFVLSGNTRITANLASPLSQGVAQSILAAGREQRVTWSPPTITSKVQQQLVAMTGSTYPLVRDTVMVAAGTPYGKGVVSAKVFDRRTKLMTTIASGPVSVTLSPTGAATVTLPGVPVPPGDYEFVEAFTDYGADKLPGGGDDFAVTRNPITRPVAAEQFSVRALRVETQSQTNVIPMPTNKVTAAGIVFTSTGATVTPVTSVSASPIRTIVDRIKVTGATPGGLVTGSLVAYPVFNGVKDCTKPSARVTYSGTADATGTLVTIAPGISVSGLVSTKWEFIESAMDAATGMTAGRVCETSPVLLVETSTFGAMTPGAVSRTRSAVIHNVESMTATVIDYVAAFGGFAGQRVTATVRAAPIDVRTNLRICALATAPVSASAVLNAQGVALIRMPAITVDVGLGLMWEFVESVTFPGGKVVGRDCATSPRLAAETVTATREVLVPPWDTGVAPAPVSATTLPPQVATIVIPRLQGTLAMPVYKLPAATPSTSVLSGLYQRGDTERLCTTGNPTIGGHRFDHGGLLRNIHWMQVGDTVTITPVGKASCKYKVVKTAIVPKADAAAMKAIAGLRPVPGVDRALTLFTCTGPTGTGTSTDYRYVVTLVRI